MHPCPPRTSRSRAILRLVALLGLLCPTMAGCGSDRVATWQVQGTVTFDDGSPVQFGTIEFYNAQHDLSARGTIRPDGTFQLGTFQEADGAVAGTHEVIVVQLVMPSTLGSSPQSHGDHIDGRFADFASSQLSATVAEHDENRCDIVVHRAK